MRLGGFKYNFPEFQHMRNNYAKHTFCSIVLIKFHKLGVQFSTISTNTNTIFPFQNKNFCKLFCAERQLPTIVWPFLQSLGVISPFQYLTHKLFHSFHFMKWQQFLAKIPIHFWLLFILSYKWPCGTGSNLLVGGTKPTSACQLRVPFVVNKGDCWLVKK